MENISVHDMLKAVNAKVAKKDKLDVLEKHDCRILRFILQANYDDNVQTILPDGEPPFNPVQKSEQTTLHAVESDLPSLFKNGPMQGHPLTEVEMLFMKMLGQLKPEEAKVLILAKDKRLQSMFKRITKPVVQEYLSEYVKIK